MIKSRKTAATDITGHGQPSQTREWGENHNGDLVEMGEREEEE